jgi:hypothetical protein
MKVKRFFTYLLFFFGICLLIANIYGLFTSLRNPDIYLEKNVGFSSDITLTEDQIYQTINSGNNDLKGYVIAVNSAINQGIAHYWLDEGIDRYHLRIPFQENYILFIASYIMPQKFLKYELIDYRQAIERGVGLCSQQAIILSEVLYEKGIKTQIVGLSGHVVVTALVDEKANEWWVLDPDYGVVIPHSIETIESTPDLIGAYYAGEGYGIRAIANLTEIYGKDGNVRSDGYGLGNYEQKTNYFEKASYLMIWIVPVFMILPFFFQRRHAIRNVLPGSKDKVNPPSHT